MTSLLRKVLNKLLALSGTPISGSLGYISAKDTVAAAAEANMSVCDYVEKLWGQQGCTQRVIDLMGSAGVFDIKSPNVLEIGAGTGRYLEKVLAKSNPARYESYEIARDWAKWLGSKYPIESHAADGVSLGTTSSNSVDLLHAHGVFVYLPFLDSYRYWKETWRVVRNGGWVVFDVFSEDCVDEQTIENWLKSEDRYPCFLSKRYLVALFKRKGFSLRTSFTNPYGAGNSEYLVFIRDEKMNDI